MRSFPAGLTVLLLACSAGCSNGRSYELSGQVLAVDPARQEITVKHDDIRGFMPAMTMPFTVRDRKTMEARKPGEMIRATLVVERSGAYLENIEHGGEAPLAADPPALRKFDLLEPDDEVPELTFTNQKGESSRLSDFRGRVLAVTFVYTRCPLPNFCPLMDRHFAAVQASLQADAALARRTHLLSVSFDPAFDTPAVLSKHAAGVGADPALWSFVTGERDVVDRFAARFGVSVLREDRSGQEIVHNLRTAVIDPRGRLVKVLTGNEWQPSELLWELRAASERG